MVVVRVLCKGMGWTNVYCDLQGRGGDGMVMDPRRCPSSSLNFLT